MFYANAAGELGTQNKELKSDKINHTLEDVYIFSLIYSIIHYKKYHCLFNITG